MDNDPGKTDMFLGHRRGRWFTQGHYTISADDPQEYDLRLPPAVLIFFPEVYLYSNFQLRIRILSMCRTLYRPRLYHGTLAKHACIENKSRNPSFIQAESHALTGYIGMWRANSMLPVLLNRTLGLVEPPIQEDDR